MIVQAKTKTATPATHKKINSSILDPFVLIDKINMNYIGIAHSDKHSKQNIGHFAHNNSLILLPLRVRYIYGGVL